MDLTHITLLVALLYAVLIYMSVSGLRAKPRKQMARRRR